jgi:hypothetical protein
MAPGGSEGKDGIEGAVASPSRDNAQPPATAVLEQRIAGLQALVESLRIGSAIRSPSAIRTQALTRNSIDQAPLDGGGSRSANCASCRASELTPRSG